VAMGRIGKRMPQLFSSDIGLIQALFEALAKVCTGTLIVLSVINCLICRSNQLIRINCN